MTKPSKKRGGKITKAIRDAASKLHRCPKGYNGPCWGPTDADVQAAIRAERGAKNGTK